MEYDIELPEAYYKLKKLNPFRHAIVAGGYLRDKVLGGKFKDLDIFVPCVSISRFSADYWDNIAKIDEEGFMTVDEGRTYGSIRALNDANDGEVLSVQNRTIKLKYKDELDIDLVGTRLNVEGFGANLISTFNYGIDQIYSDGKRVVTSPAFDYDVTNSTSTMLSVSNARDLPTGIKKYLRLQEKYPFIGFRTDYVLTKRTGDDWL